MNNKWKVTSNFINGITMYGVYRTINTDKIDHSGNRENFGEYMGSRQEAGDLANKLNKEQNNKENVVDTAFK